MVFVFCRGGVFVAVETGAGLGWSAVLGRQLGALRAQRMPRPAMSPHPRGAEALKIEPPGAETQKNGFAAL